MKKLIAGLALSLSMPLAALEIGQPMPYLTLDDQHGEAHAIATDLNVLIFTRDKAGSDVASGALEGVEQGTLEQSGIVYVADTSIMPALITRMFALPKMRKQSFLTMMDTQGSATAAFPFEDGKVSLMRFEQGSLHSIEHIDDAEALKAALAL
ncbi:hypothetical protein [Ferrimonas marina]|uniref:FAD/FMN-containing dehydrogenase n=1 Tax=Ferrimonas marina TaxID=299255 RepID=A0A1M5YVA3_9GAMM|nr:hypothetical protein [Ferrimonas marina]SHI15473.1 hypothetical protein SAMN02745129_4439 [Ferrimonas marina]